MLKLKLLTISIILVMFLSLARPASNVSAAGTSPTLTHLLNVSVLAGSSITNVPTTTTSGDRDVSPGPAINPGGWAGTGTSHFVDLMAFNAQAEALTVWAFLDQLCDYTFPVGADLSTTSIGGGIAGQLPPGVYCSGTGFSVSTTINLTGGGTYIFKTVSTLDAAVGATVTGGDPCNVWWRIGSSTTLNGSSSFVGTIISQTGSNAMGSNAALNGRFLALSGAGVTLNQNTITGPSCSTTTNTALSASSITTGGIAIGTANLSGANSSTATGSVTYNVYSDAALTTLVQSSGPFAVVGGVVPNSSALTFPAAGTYYWQAVYSGDTNNAPSVSAAQILTVTSATSAPQTGFAPNRMTALPVQNADQAYAAMGDLWLEIPRLGVRMNIVGVPLTAGTWDASWLGKDAGWLNGSAFPTYAGNSVLTGHVYDAYGRPGPFVRLNQMWYGDKVIVHAWGAQYVYEVRSVTQIGPKNTAAMMKSEQLPWVTLVTCRGYDEATNSYKYRVLVRAVLVEVK